MSSGRRTKFLGRMYLQHQHAEIEGDRIEARRECDPRAARLCGFMIFVDHLAHPHRFTTQVGIVGSGIDAGLYQWLTIKLVRSDGGQHHLGTLGHYLQRGRIISIGNHQRGIGRRSDQVAHFLQLGQRTPRHRPAPRPDIDTALSLLGQIFGNQPTGVTSGTINDDIKFARFLGHHSLLILLWEE